jgi:hypothetical protein
MKVLALVVMIAQAGSPVVAQDETSDRVAANQAWSVLGCCNPARDYQCGRSGATQGGDTRQDPAVCDLSQGWQFGR